MWRSTERILVSHAGALPRPENVQRLFDAYPQEQDAFAAALPDGVRQVVGQQVAAGVDVVNDGEISKRGLFIGYIRDRMAGFEDAPVRPGQDRPAVFSHGNCGEGTDADQVGEPQNAEKGASAERKH